jgi:hypothetical protein
LSPPPDDERIAASASTTTRPPVPIHSQGGCFLRAAATADFFGLPVAMNFTPGLFVLVGRCEAVAGPGDGQQGEDEKKP